MYILFSGTSDFRDDLYDFLNSNVSGYTSTQSQWLWNGFTGAGDVFYFFTVEDAYMTRDFLKIKCNQKEVPIINLNGLNL